MKKVTRREFLEVATGGSAAVALGSAGIVEATAANPQSASVAGGRKLIIPTDNPDRFHAKVMEFNPVRAVDESAWRLEVGGMVTRPLRLSLAEVRKLAMVRQNSRMKCVQCWSTRITWEGFRTAELLKLAKPLPGATHLRLDCADRYYDFNTLAEMLHPHTLFALKMNGEALSPEHGAPLRLVMPAKYGYKSSKLITKITLLNHGGQGVVADTWPYYTQGGDIQPGYDHPFVLPGQTRKIAGGEITDY